MRAPGGTNEKRMQPTCRRSAHTGQLQGSAAASSAISSESGAGLAVCRGRDRQQAAAVCRRAAAEGHLRRAAGVDHRVVRRHLDAVDRDYRADDAVVERHLRERVQHDQRRVADGVRLAG